MGILLAILGLIGAIPDIINAVKAIWELIKQIRDRKTRLAAKKKLETLVMAHVDHDKKAIKDAVICSSELGAFRDEVVGILEKEHAQLTALKAGKKKK